MGLEDALKILEQYDEGCPPEGRESLACGCGECADEKGKKGGKSEDGEADPVGIDTSAKTNKKGKAAKKEKPAKKKRTTVKTATTTAKKQRTTRASK
jgi:hypothetical protein